MHKLKPILVHRFWILFALALLLPVFGWFQTSGRLAAETKARREAIDQKERAIPRGSDIPNDQWVTDATAMVDRQAKLQERVHMAHWMRQAEYMVWHPIIAEQIAKVPYRGEIRNREREQYRSGLYLESAAEVWRIVSPYDGTTERGLVVCPESALGFVPSERWSRNAPSSAEIWDAQEDLWLTASLLSAIAKVNENVVEGAGHSGRPLSITEAPIRAVEQFRLHGGVRSPARRRLWASRRTGEAPADGTAPPPSEPPPEGEGVAGPGAAAAASGPVGVDFEPSDEYDGVGGDPATEGNHDRYIDVNYTQIPFRTRGFYLRLKMDQRHLPELLVALASLPWDVRISRVNQKDVASDPINADPSGRQAGAGGARPRPPVTPRGPATSSEATGIAEKALADPYIAVVTIGGALTLYNKPSFEIDPNAPPSDGTVPSAEGAAGPAPTGDPPPATPPTDGTSPATPPAAPSADGVPPAGTAPPSEAVPTSARDRRPDGRAAAVATARADSATGSAARRVRFPRDGNFRQAGASHALRGESRSAEDIATAVSSAVAGIRRV